MIFHGMYSTMETVSWDNYKWDILYSLHIQIILSHPIPDIFVWEKRYYVSIAPSSATLLQ